MFDFTRLFRKTFRTDARFGKRTLTARRSRTHLALEALEDRLVPTVEFTPQLGATFETSTASANSSSLQSPPVVLLFTGNYWQGQQGQQDEQSITSSVGSILSGPYLSKLTQYGSDGHATLAQGYQVSNTPTLDGGNTPSGQTLLNFVNNIISTNPDVVPPTDPSNPQQAPLYVVVNDPQDSAGSGSWGYNDTDGTTHAIYVGNYANTAGGPVNMDLFTATFSHELAEAVASAITVSDPGNTNANNGNPLQIADGEPDNGPTNSFYDYRLNGILVQAYWSQSDGAFVVPDGNTQNFNLQPIWNANTTNFTGQYNLDLSIAGSNQSITIGQTPAGGVAATMNGESVAFDSGTISNVNVTMGSGTNQVNVAALPAGVTLNASDFDPVANDVPNDTVTIGSNGSLANIAGTVNVGNSSNSPVNLVVNDSNGASGQSAQITSNSVSFSDMPGQVNYTGTAMVNGAPVAVVSSLQVDTSPVSTITVSSTDPNTPVALVTDYGSGQGSNVYIQGSSSAVSVQSNDNDNVIVGNAGSLAGIGGPVNVSNMSSGQDNLTIDDSNDSSDRFIDMTSNAVTFGATGSEPAVTINYTPAAINPNNGQMLGVNQLTLLDALGPNLIEVDSVGLNATTTIDGDSQDALFGNAAGLVQFNVYR